MTKQKADQDQDMDTDNAGETEHVTDITPEGHLKRLGESAKAQQERWNKLGGEPVEVEFLSEAVYDSEIHEPGSVVEMPELDARNLVHLGVAKYNANNFVDEKKPNVKKLKAAKSKA